MIVFTSNLWNEMHRRKQMAKRDPEVRARLEAQAKEQGIKFDPNISNRQLRKAIGYDEHLNRKGRPYERN